MHSDLTDRVTATSEELTCKKRQKRTKPKSPWEWTTWNATIGDKPKKRKQKSHDPKVHAYLLMLFLKNKKKVTIRFF